MDLGCERGGRMWFKISVMPSIDAIEEILSDADTNNMVYYNNGHQDNIHVFMVEHKPYVLMIPAELMQWMASRT